MKRRKFMTGIMALGGSALALVSTARATAADHPQEMVATDKADRRNPRDSRPVRRGGFGRLPGMGSGLF